MADLRVAPAPATRPVHRLVARLRDPVVHLIAAQLLMGLAALAANVMMVRALDPAHRGQVALLLQVVYLASQGLLLGTERSFVAAYHEVPPAAAIRAYARLLVVPCGLGVAVVAGYAALAPPRLDPGPLVLALIAAFALVEAAGLATRSIAIAAGRARDFLTCRLVETGLLLGGMTALFLAGAARPEAWLLAYLLAGALPTVGFVAYWLRRPAAPVGDHNRVVRRQGLTLFPAALSNMAMLRSDRLALPALASTAALGLYAAVATMTELLAWPLRAYADSRLGRWRRAHREGRLRTRRILAGSALFVLAAGPPLAAGLYLLVVPVFGDRYAPARAVVLPLVAAAGLYALSRVSLGLLVAKGHGALVSAAEIAGFAVSFAGYLLLIPAHGMLGAAYGSLLGYGACLVFALLADRIPRAAP